jgi:hypothetical protein
VRPFIPRFENLGFSGRVYKLRSNYSTGPHGLYSLFIKLFPEVFYGIVVGAGAALKRKIIGLDS